MKSMTGYGRGECAEKGFKVTVEVSSVNRKQTEISVNLPRDVEVLEAQIRDEINRVISRGRLTVRVGVHAGASAAGAAKIDVSLAKAYARELARLARELKLSNDTVTLDVLLRSPGVMQTPEELSNAEELWPAVHKALRSALDALVKMREREGAHLTADLKARMKLMRRAASRIQEHAPSVAKRYREQLQQRIQAAGLEMPSVEDERLLKEVIYFAERSDISEELTRLQSHFKQFEECVQSKEPVGRTLDFLSQEINREVNTVGSKANDAAISREVVTLKAELERFREQVQNVE
jgi:uncharacterized protein (TIGR00255 family)